ncbi:MAG: gamma-butyrobetaine,2-oxoglutarate dioxygenase [Thiotrichales bacterium]|nr:gamma-butyrobetaine,2-oxoglutarate dioxygenase [Thiotrichales bacterium]
MTTLTMLDNGLQISGRTRSFYVNNYWLRDHCRSAFHPQTRERIFDIWAQKAAPRPASAEIVDDELRIHWKGEDVESRYPLEWLEKTIDQGSRADPAALPDKLWYADHVDQMSRFPWAVLEKEPSMVAAWARTLLEQGFALVTDLPDTDEAISNLARLLGPVTSSVGIYHDEVIYQPDPVNAAFTSDALEMHTDTPNESPPPGLKLFHCRTNTVEGGDNLYIDGFAVANDFRKSHPQDFDLLCRHQIPYVYQNEGFDYRARHSIIELDHRGELAAVRISRHLVDVVDLAQEELDDFYAAFHRFGRLFLDPHYLLRFRMQPGECAVIDNYRVAHGRDAYSTSNGSRHFRNCFVDRGELQNTYRLLVKNGVVCGVEEQVSPAPPWALE